MQPRNYTKKEFIWAFFKDASGQLHKRRLLLDGAERLRTATIYSKITVVYSTDVMSNLRNLFVPKDSVNCPWQFCYRKSTYIPLEFLALGNSATSP
ncbi:hypothetical protein NPIL_73211 [Nephila pilipes]|uniref:Uncharacterized protein n=1 Tax=Nephila pilipes TaxID=299642 RepID=A0A8X6T394_NEPPI|nr:hypothetical protein NPIL_73211 [Nephila pilipes]